MAKETKNVTLRLPVHVVEYLEKSDYSINQAVIDAVEKLEMVEKYADRDIQNKFTEAEWKYLADSLNGTMVEGDFRFYSAALTANIEDSARYDGLDTKWDVDPEQLTTKIKALSSSAIDAIHRRVERFWNTDRPVDLDEWAKY